MASVSLYLSLTLIFSASITTATVNLYQDGSVCGGMTATVVCSTNTTTGRLEWRINNGPVVYTIDNTVSVNDNITITSGSLFVFNQRSTTSGTVTVTSTASLNTSHVTSVQCFDGVIQESHTIQLQVHDVVSCTSVSVNDNSVEVSWTPPPSAGVCCERYHVRTSDGTITSTTMTNYTLERQLNAFAEIHCLDQLGTMGPEAFCRSNIFLIATATNPSTLPTPIVGALGPDSNYCCDNIIFRLNFTIMEPNFGNVSNLTGCVIVEDESSAAVNGSCMVEDGVAFLKTDRLVSFYVTLQFFDQYGLNNSNKHLRNFDAGVYLTACEIKLWQALFGTFFSLFILYGGAASVVIGILSYVIHKLRNPPPSPPPSPKPTPKPEGSMHYNQEDDIVKFKE